MKSISLLLVIVLLGMISSISIAYGLPVVENNAYYGTGRLTVADLKVKREFEDSRLFREVKGANSGQSYDQVAEGVEVTKTDGEASEPDFTPHEYSSSAGHYAENYKSYQNERNYPPSNWLSARIMTNIINGGVLLMAC